MAPALRKDAHATPTLQLLRHRLIHLLMADPRGDRKGAALEPVLQPALDPAILAHLVPTRQLPHGRQALERLLQQDLVLAPDLGDGGAGGRLADLGQHEQAADLEGRVLEVGADAAHEAGRVVGVRQVEAAAGRLDQVEGSPHGHGAGQPREEADPAPLHRFLGDEEGDAPAGFLADGAHHDEGVDELGRSGRAIVSCCVPFLLSMPLCLFGTKRCYVF
ncbi:hypothetical protein BDY21DRAFT_171298 [Lineolata rhizophorae]|uniref:Uncharacterized protein n=1 Tax=Lineolata rhizophorae TaxID=578093 RepID=A0A6A6P9L8_9PEZI|nr:hypothetical protein BDY21DRAFT_171298 [Lineolata rhizophorae]